MQSGNASGQSKPFRTGRCDTYRRVLPLLDTKGVPFDRDVTVYDKLKDKETMQSFTCNERVLGAMMESGLMEFLLNEGEKKLWYPFLIAMVQRHETSLDCMVTTTNVADHRRDATANCNPVSGQPDSGQHERQSSICTGGGYAYDGSALYDSQPGVADWIV